MSGKNVDDNDLPDGTDLSHWDLPEDFVLDEAFIKAGVPERPVRTGEHLPPRVARGASSTPAPAALPTRNPWLTLLRVGALITVAWMVIGWLTSGIAPVRAGSPAGTSTGASASPWLATGIAANDPFGSCYFSYQTAVPRRTDPVTLSRTDCTLTHNYELLLSARAADTVDGAYPDDAYWDGTVQSQCNDSLAGYTGLPADQWPSGLSAVSLVPQADSWADGARGVLCLAFSTEYLTATVQA